MEIPHNFFNLPNIIKQGTNTKAIYTYLADGTKYKVTNGSNVGFDYIGSFKYSRNNSNITLESATTAGGRTYKTSGGYEVRYFISDHLGSTRLVTNSSGTILEQNDYMPYGDRHSNSALATSTNPYLYNGKESQKSFGVNYIDSEARFQRLDGAFNSIDPLCEKNYWVSPYSYCGGNPILHIDPNGKLFDDYFNKFGKFLGTDNAITNEVRIISQIDWDNNAINNIINHDIGNKLSTSVIDTPISSDAAINIIKHYNDILNIIDTPIDIPIATVITDDRTAMQYNSGHKEYLWQSRYPVIEVNISRGTLSKSLHTVFNIMNSLIHERDHITYKGEKYQPKREIHAINTQKKHFTWYSTTNNFKIGINNYESSENSKIRHNW